MTSLREAPATVPALGAIVLFIVWAAGQAGVSGHPLGARRHDRARAAGALRRHRRRARRRGAACRADLPRRARRATPRSAMPRSCGRAIGGRLGRRQPDAPLPARLRPLRLLAPARGQRAALLLGVWTLSLVGLALFVAVHLDAASTPPSRRLFPEGRLTYPSGYANANAAEAMPSGPPSDPVSPRTVSDLRRQSLGGAALWWRSQRPP